MNISSDGDDSSNSRCLTPIKIVTGGSSHAHGASSSLATTPNVPRRQQQRKANNANPVISVSIPTSASTGQIGGGGGGSSNGSSGRVKKNNWEKGKAAVASGQKQTAAAASGSAVAKPPKVFKPTNFDLRIISLKDYFDRHGLTSDMIFNKFVNSQ